MLQFIWWAVAAAVSPSPSPGAYVTPSPTPTATATPTLTPTPTPSPTPMASIGSVPVSYETGPIILALGLLVLAGLLFYFAFRYSGRLDHTHYLTSVFTSALAEAERRQLVARLEEDWERGRYHERVLLDDEWFEKNKPDRPPEIKDDPAVQSAWQQLRSWRGGNMRPGYGDPWGTGTPPPGLRAEVSSEEAERERKVRGHLAELRNWQVMTLDVEARRRYQADTNEKVTEAEERAKRALGDLDLGVLRGRGPQFILQFTAVVVIILSTVTLAVLGRLSSEQAGTILAAIAGYVLGQSGRPETPPSSPTTSAAAQTGTPKVGENAKQGKNET